MSAPDGPPTKPVAATTRAADEAATDVGATGQAPADSPTGERLAQAAAAHRRFGTSAPVLLGRFRVLERLGAGGMGVVYSAYDPELDRAVALKLVHVPIRGHAAALAEAKALARLSHPNVVPVHDVGIDGEHLYIVMELVRGETLRRWVKPRRRAEILDAYRQAGHALAAAHAAGLVHRDFKPDNAIVGSDGRVRVVDFGLACEITEAPRPAAGTPRYMPPEQTGARAVTPAADQYSFCVALAEALGGEPLPRWLAAVLDRGRAVEPAARFESMTALLRALGRDPARLWRQRALLAAVAIGGVSAFVAGRASSDDAPADTCDGADAELASAWSPPARAAALARIAGLGVYGRELAPRLTRALDTHAARWTAGYRDACVAHRRGVQSDALLDRRMACLARGRAALAAVATIAEAIDAGALPEVALAVQALPDPVACADAGALLAAVAPPPPALAPAVAGVASRVERARVLLAAGRLADAGAEATGAVADARPLGYPPVLAEALLVAGHATMSNAGGRLASVPTLAEATAIAFAAGAEATAIEAWARRAWAQGTASDPAAALAGLDVIDAIAARAATGGFARALLHNNVGSIELARGQRAHARAAFERALVEARDVSGRGALELVIVRSNLALVTDDPVRRDDLLADAEVELADRLGDSHPQTLWVRATRAALLPEARRAAELLAPTCAGYDLHPTLAGLAVRCWFEVGILRDEVGDAAGASAAMERAAALEPTSIAGGYQRLWRGQAGAAASHFAAALAALPPRAEQAPWELESRADLELGLGRALRRAGRSAEARAALEACVASLTASGGDGPAVQRRLARARAELAAASR